LHHVLASLHALSIIWHSLHCTAAKLCRALSLALSPDQQKPL